MAYEQSAPQNGNRKQANSFINISIPTADGGKQKLGFISLTCENANQKEIHEHLVNNPEDVAKLFGKLVYEFRENKPAEKSISAADLFA